MVNFMIPMVAAAAVVAAMPAKRQTSFGTAKIINNCNQNLTLYSVGSQAQGPFVLAANTGTYSEPYRVDPSSGGIALKVLANGANPYDGSRQTIFSYSLVTTSDAVWYDLSDVNGDLFSGSKLVAAPSDSSCPAIDWENGTSPSGSQVKECGAGSDLTLTLCAK